jgi:hypothetical protein
MGNDIFPRLYGGTPSESRTQDNVQTVLGPLANRLGATPIMGAAPPAWIRTALSGGFTTLAPLTLPAYHRDALGYVHVKGVLVNLTGAPIAGGVVAFTLPAGYRPNESRGFPSNDGAGGAQEVVVTPAGAVSFLLAVANAGSGSVEFSFLAEQ